MTAKKKYQAPALEKGLDILEFLSLKATPLSQTEIADGLEKNTNEIFRMLVCLEERSYLIRDEVSGKYRLSLKLYNLSHRHSPVDEIRKVSRYPMEELAEITKQSCHLGIVYHDKLIVVYQAKSPGPISLSIEEGSLFSLINTASGRTLLACMDEEQRMELLNRNESYQKLESSAQKEYLDSLSNIREAGHYVHESETTQGVTDVVVPIGDSGSSVYASLAVSILTSQLDKTISLEKITKEAEITAQRIEKDLGI